MVTHLLRAKNLSGEFLEENELDVFKSNNDIKKNYGDSFMIILV